MVALFILFWVLVGLIVLGSIGTFVFMEVYGWDSPM